MTDYRDLDAIGTAAAIAAGEFSAAELVDATIERIERHNPALNAVIATRYAQARADVRAGLPQGRLTGVPTLIKDLGPRVEGLPQTRGSKLWADDVATSDSLFVSRLKDEGMVILGTTNTPELGLSTSTEPQLYGPTHNPWSLDYSPGGSSGGSAAAVAAGLVPVAHGNDGGGSIRMPSSMCGLFGLKPSRARVSTLPDPGVLAGVVSVQHMLTRTVRDSALLLDIVGQPVHGQAVGAPAPRSGSFLAATQEPVGSLRIGLLTERIDGGEIDPQMRANAEAAAQAAQEMGHRVEPTQWPNIAATLQQGFTIAMGMSSVMQVRDRLKILGRELRDDDLEPFARALYDLYSQSLSVYDYFNALQAIQTAAWSIGRLFNSYDVLLTTTATMPVPKLGILDTRSVETMFAKTAEYAAMTSPFNATGSPAMSVPWGTNSEGLPIGIQFVADFGREDLLLSLASRWEQAHPWPLVAPGYS